MLKISEFASIQNYSTPRSYNAECVLVPQSCLTLCDPVDCSPPGSSVHGILQARILERAAMSSSRDLPEPGLNLGLPHEQADSLPSETVGKPYSVVPVFNRGGY